MAAEKVWMGKVPDLDDFGGKIVDEFVDGRVITGPWATMNPAHHKMYGLGIGTGQGQRYKKSSDGRWIKVEG